MQSRVVVGLVDGYVLETSTQVDLSGTERDRPRAEVTCIVAAVFFLQSSLLFASRSELTRYLLLNKGRNKDRGHVGTYWTWVGVR